MNKTIFHAACAAIAMTILVGNASEATEFHAFNGSPIASGNHSAEIVRNIDWGGSGTESPILGISLQSNGNDVLIKMAGITVYNSIDNSRAASCGDS